MEVVKKLFAVALLLYSLASQAAQDVALSIWNPEFEAAAQALLPYAFFVITLFVFFAKLNEPYKCAHLLCGIVLILVGIFSLEIALMNKTLMSVLFETQAITKNARELADLRWSVFQIAIPALSFSFGTRFVGNWVTASRPAPQ